MKLTPVRIDRALSQIEAQVVPENHTVMPQFNRLFGDHTFFIDGSGLNIVELEDADDDGAEIGRVVKLASWIDESHTSLAQHERELTDMVVVLGRAA
jgi:hypothetical protein